LEYAVVGKKRIFVGRKIEVERFVKVLEQPRGEEVVVVNQKGMGAD
jgi:hypothetical protein